MMTTEKMRSEDAKVTSLKGIQKHHYEMLIENINKSIKCGLATAEEIEIKKFIESLK